MKATRAFTGAVLAILAVGAGADEPKTADILAVRIVPTGYHEKTGRAIEVYGPSQHFHVVVTNVSDRPVKLWRDWCSWGYFSLSFVATGEDGKPVTVGKKLREWMKNFPDATIVPPGDHMVFEVALDDDVWKDPPLPERGQSRTVRLRAVYTIRNDQEAEKFGVWTGRVSSPEETYTLWK
jgi:hypothetical protein